MRMRVSRSTGFVSNLVKASLIAVALDRYVFGFTKVIYQLISISISISISFKTTTLSSIGSWTFNVSNLWRPKWFDCEWEVDHDFVQSAHQIFTRGRCGCLWFTQWSSSLPHQTRAWNGWFELFGLFVWAVASSEELISPWYDSWQPGDEILVPSQHSGGFQRVVVVSHFPLTLYGWWMMYDWCMKRC